MKNRIFIFCTVLGAMGFMAFRFVKTKEQVQAEEIQMEKDEAKKVAKEKTWVDEKDFFYGYGTPFNPVKKSMVLKAESILDFLDDQEKRRVETYKTVNIIIIENDERTSRQAISKGPDFSPEQLELLHSLDFSSNFLVKADVVYNNLEMMKEGEITPHMTIVPEKQATYFLGEEALLDYFRMQNAENVQNIDTKKAKPAKICFTVSKEGQVKDVRLDRTSGFPQMDAKMVELLKNLPGSWEAAENENGEKIEEEKVLSFGIAGC
jgi:hypothetical protein